MKSIAARLTILCAFMLLLIVVVMILAEPVQAGPAIADAGVHSISGQILDSQSEPAPDLRVQFIPENGQIADEVRTDPNGIFRFDLQQAQSYRLRLFSSDGRPLPWEGDQRFEVPPEQESRDIHHTIRLMGYPPALTDPDRRQPEASQVEPAALAQEHNMLAEGNGEIAGTVTDADSGVPLPAVYIRLYDADDKSIGFDSTGADGAYRFSQLASGSYKLQFRPRTFGDSESYLAQYFDNKPDLESATPIVLAADETLTIDAVLARGGTIQGKVTGDQMALADVTVEAYDANGDRTAYDFTDDEGNYHIQPLTPGIYRLKFDPFGSFNPVTAEFQPEFHADQPALASATPISVSLRQTITVNADLIRGGKILGRITDETTDDPLEGIDVTIYDGDDRYAGSQTTDASGMYAFMGLTTDSYRLKFEPSSRGPSAEYLAEYYNNKFTLSEADIIALTAPDVLDNTDVQLKRAGRISGQITAASGQRMAGLPLPAIFVSAYDLDGGLAESTETDEDGHYTITGLEDGIYWLSAKPDNDDVSAAYLPGQHLDPLTVVAPAEIGNIDLALELGGQIAGRVTVHETGLPLGDVRVSVYDGDESYRVLSAETDADGAYTTTGLLPGSYRLRFVPDSYGDASGYLSAYYENAPNLPSTRLIQVPGPLLINDIDAELRQGGRITGIVSARDSGLPLEDIDVSAYNARGGKVASGDTDEDGQYELEGLAAGSYRIEFSPPNYSASRPAGDYLSTFYDGRLGLAEADVVTVSGSAVVPDIDALLDRGGQIAGTVAAADTGQPLADVWVVLYDGDGVFIDSDTTDDDSGSFRFHGLSSGQYRLKFDPPDKADGRGAAYVETYSGGKPSLASATSIQVSASDTSVGDQALARGGQITGQIVVAGDGSPAANVYLRAYNDDTGIGSDGVTTDDDGVYSTPGLASGRYWIAIEDVSHLLGPVDVVAPDVVANIDGAVPPTKVGSGVFAGRVLADGTSRPLEDVDVDLDSCPWDDSDWTNHLGVYYHSRIPAGDYSLSIDPTDRSPSAPYRLIPPAQIRIGADQQIIDRYTMALGGRIDGRVTSEDTGQPLEYVDINIYDAEGRYVGDVDTDAIGRYKTVGLADGMYRLHFRADSDTGYLAEYSGDQPSLETALSIAVSGIGVVATHDAALKPGGRIAGTVTAADTGLPLDDVDVDVYDAAGDQVASTETDERGRYTTSVLDSGRYRVRFDTNHRDSTAPYVRTFYGGQAAIESAQELVLDAPNDVSGIDISLARGGRIAGRVTDDVSGQPLEDVSVIVYDASGAPVARGNTNRVGLYQTNGIRAGDHRVHFRLETFDCETGETQIDEYYSDRPDLPSANPIAVPGDGIVGDIDAGLRGGTPPPSSRIFLPFITR